jgi:hypothetical protein
MVGEYCGDGYWDVEGYFFALYPWRHNDIVAIGIVTLTASMPLTRSLVGGLETMEILAERFRLIVPPLFDSTQFDYDPLPCVYIVSVESPGEAQTRPTPQLLMPSDFTPAITCLVPLIERPKGWPP